MAAAAHRRSHLDPRGRRQLRDERARRLRARGGAAAAGEARREVVVCSAGRRACSR
jgi:hypothetical protein